MADDIDVLARVIGANLSENKGFVLLVFNLLPKPESSDLHNGTFVANIAIKDVKTVMQEVIDSINKGGE